MEKGSGNYFISLGAGKNQIPLIEAANQLGFETIAIDQNINAPGFSISSVSIEESILNYRKILYKLSLAVDSSEIAGVYSASYGNALLSTAYLAEHLKLPGLSRTLIESLLDKYSVRKALENIQHPAFSQPAFMIAQPIMHKKDFDSLEYPIIIKARESSGKHKIFQVNNFSEIREFFSVTNMNEMGLKKDFFLMESKITGDEIIVTGIITDFSFHLLTISDKKHSTEPPFIDLEHTFPSRYQQMQKSISELMQEIIQTLQIPLGPIVAEFRTDGEVFYLIEISPQIPGEYIGEYMIPLSTGEPFYEHIVRVMTGSKPNFSKKRKEQPVQIEYLVQPVPENEWKQKAEKSKFARILNPNPIIPPKSNSDRFAVIVK